jgi:hypothetical protein
VTLVKAVLVPVVAVFILEGWSIVEGWSIAKVSVSALVTAGLDPVRYAACDPLAVGLGDISDEFCWS